MIKKAREKLIKIQVKKREKAPPKMNDTTQAKRTIQWLGAKHEILRIKLKSILNTIYEVIKTKIYFKCYLWAKNTHMIRKYNHYVILKCIQLT